jgi:hypothetical protein
VIGPCSPDIGGDAAELVLECLRLPHRAGGSELLPAAVRDLDEIVQAPSAMPTSEAPCSSGRKCCRD